MLIFRKIFHFLSSLKLAVIVLISFAYVLALGTVQESLHGTAYAQEAVYRTPWFSTLMLLLGVNVLCAALSRWPWKKHHLGFVVTHAGIITILIGSFVTQKWGVDGSIALAEGENTNRISLTDPLIQVSSVDAKILNTFPAHFLKNPPSPLKPQSFPLREGGRLIVDQFYLNAEATLSVREGVDENPALKIVLSGLPMGAGKELSQWLFQKETEWGGASAQIGPATLKWVTPEELKKINAPQASHLLGQLKLKHKDGREWVLDLSKKQEEQVALKDSDFQVHFIRYLPDARVVEGKLVSKSNEAINPALEFKITDSHSFQESHLVFSQFPDLEGVHGKQKEDAVFSSLLSSPPLLAQKKGELYFARAEDGSFEYRVLAQGKLSPIQKVNLKETTPTGWMTIQFRVDEFFERSKVGVDYHKINLPPGKQGPPPAIHLKLQKEGKTEEAWLGQGDVKQLVLNLSLIHI